MLTNQEVNMHEKDVVEMRMLRWACDKTRKDKIRNLSFLEHLGVTTIGDKIIKKFI